MKAQTKKGRIKILSRKLAIQIKLFLVFLILASDMVSEAWLMTIVFFRIDFPHLNKKKLKRILHQIKVMKKLFLFPLLALLFSCQPSKITQTWGAKDAVPKKYKKILVLGVLTESENELQVKMEDHLADDLKALGYNTVAANKLFPPGTFVRGDTARAKSAIEGKGFDGILTVVLLDKNKEQVYIPGKITDLYYYNRYGRFDRYLNQVSERIFTPGYYAEETRYIWENNFYDIDSRELLYSARSRSFDVASKNTLAHTYGQLMVESLVKKNILVKPDNEYEKK